MRDGIGVQLLIAIVLFSSVVTLILSAIDLYVAYRVAYSSLTPVQIEGSRVEGDLRPGQLVRPALRP